jgi:argininosuccinate synthase
VLGPALRAGATGPPVVRATALARPIVAAVLVEVARMEKASSVAHGGVGPDHEAFARLLADHAPELAVVPLDGEAQPRDTAPRITANLWGRTVLFPAPADAHGAVPATLFTRTSDPTAIESHPAHVDLAFSQGFPVAVNGIAMSFLEVAEVVDTIAGDHGVGRVDRISRSAGGGTREITEAPAALTLAIALADLEHVRLDPRLAVLKQQVSVQYAALIDSGDWFSASRQALEGFLATAMSTVSGTVRVMLSRGACRVVGRELTERPHRVIASASAGIEPAL